MTEPSKLILTKGDTPSELPDEGKLAFYPKSDGWYYIDELGNETKMDESVVRSKLNNINVAKTGGDFDSIQDAIDYAIVTYPHRTSNNPVVITVYPGDYEEQIHSYVHILIQGSASAYDPEQGKSKAIISNTGLGTNSCPLRTQTGDVYYMLGIAIDLTSENGMYGKLPEGTFKNCYFKNGHFLENDNEIQTNSQFKDCTFAYSDHGGFYLYGTTNGYRNLFLIDCTMIGNPKFNSDHTNGWGHVGIENCAIQGSLTYGGDWELNAVDLKTWNVAERNEFNTTGFVKIQGGYMVNGIHFSKNPAELSLLDVAFSSVKENMIINGNPDVTSDVLIYGKIQNNIMHNGFPSEIHMSNPDKFVGVAQHDGYSSLKAALDSITDSDKFTRYTIQVSAGIYTEDNPLQGKEYVNVKAIGDFQTTRIVALNPDEDLINIPQFFTMEGFALWGVTGSDKYAIKQEVSGITDITRCYFGECSNGVLLDHVNGEMSINGCSTFAYNSLLTMETGVTCKSGFLNINTLISSAGVLNTLIKVTGVSSKVIANNIISLFDTTGIVISVSDLAQVDVNNSKLLNMATAIEAEGGSHVHLNGVRVENASSDGLRINALGTDTFMNAQSTIIKGSTGYDINLLCSTCLFEGQISSSLNNIHSVQSAKIYGVIIDLEEDDEGVTVLGELHIGVPENPTESVFGEGDSYTRGMLAYAYNGAGYTDISDDVRSPTDSLFSFPNNNINTAIYLASDLIVNATLDFHKYFGIKMHLTTPQIDGTIIAEYYNGTDWVELKHMTAQSGGSYYRKADLLFTVDAGNYQVRFNPDMDLDWAKSNVPVVGATDRYWIRFRITASPTTLPVFEQFKLHSNRHEINSDGFEEDMGKARPLVGISVPWSSFQDASSRLGNKDLYKSNNSFAGMENNLFDADGESIGTILTLPPWVDTSGSLKLVVAVVCNTTGVLEMEATLNSTLDGDEIFLSSPGNTVGEVVSTVSHSVLEDRQQTFTFDLDISDKGIQADGVSPETLWLNISATDIPGSGEVYGMVFNVGFLSWRRGTHI